MAAIFRANGLNRIVGDGTACDRVGGVFRSEASDIARLLDEGWKITELVHYRDAIAAVGFNGSVRLQRGSERTSIALSNADKAVICFTPGTLIATSKGMVRVEELCPGDKVITRDNAYQAVKWAGRQDLGKVEMALMPYLQPILIRAGAIGADVPDRDILVSPNHRILINSKAAALMFGDKEVLVAARDLTHLPGVDRVETDRVSYIHLLFEKHELVMSDVLWTESFQPGPRSLNGLDRKCRTEIFDLFPELSDRRGLADYNPVRRCLKQHEARLLTI